MKINDRLQFGKVKGIRFAVSIVRKCRHSIIIDIAHMCCKRSGLKEFFVITSTGTNSVVCQKVWETLYGELHAVHFESAISYWPKPGLAAVQAELGPLTQTYKEQVGLRRERILSSIGET